jgi:hypothetical protein
LLIVAPVKIYRDYANKATANQSMRIIAARLTD